MRIELQDNVIILSLKSIPISFNEAEEVEAYFKTILIRLKNYYNIDITGFYNVTAYVDSKEGVVFHIEKDNIDYYSTFHQLEIRMIKEDTVFFYEVDDLFALPLDEVDVYIYSGKIYVKGKDGKKVYQLYEFGKLIYENTSGILANGHKIARF